MLCKNCEKAIQAAAKHFQLGQGMAVSTASNVQPRLNCSFLHFSLHEFRRSIAAGCYFCRHLEDFLRDEAKLRTGDELGDLDFRPPRLVDRILTRAVNWTIQHILIPCTIYTGSNISKGLLNAAQQWCTRSYLFWIYILPSLEIEVLPFGFKHIHNSLPGLGSTSPWTFISFVLSSISPDSPSVDPHSDARLRNRSAWTGDSIALWHSWFNTCLEKHTLCRSVEQRIQPYSPKRLVELILDTQGVLSMWSLVSSPTIGTVPYFTLSHCWGSSQPLHLMKDNISLLSTPSPVYRLPETYRHALEIVNSLGYKYIWIDSLCIVQDDEEDWQIESSLMGLTYNHAICNIAATWATHGGDGCFSTRSLTTICPTFITINVEVHGSSTYQISRAGDFSYHKDITRAPLNKRGWVVQERYLARRQLSCAKRQLYWECHELLASEEFPCGHPADNPTLEWPSIGANGSPRKPCLDLSGGVQTRQDWAALVELYSGCQLTRASDKLVALSGLVNQLQSMANDEYVFGLWTRDLCDQLCWDPLYYNRDIPRTTSQGRIAPTWSWANFDGAVDFDRAYYRTCPKYKNWTEVAETPIDGTRKLRLPGLALKSRISWKDMGDFWGKQPHLLLDRLRTPYIPASSSTQVSIRWDENILKEDVNPEQWSNFQSQRNSDLLFLVVRSRTYTGGEEVEGLILRMLPHSSHDPVLYIRMGTFSLHDTGDHALGHVASWSVMREYETEESPVADPIQTVTII